MAEFSTEAEAAERMHGFIGEAAAIALPGKHEEYNHAAAEELAAG